MKKMIVACLLLMSASVLAKKEAVVFLCKENGQIIQSGITGEAQWNPDEGVFMVDARTQRRLQRGASRNVRWFAEQVSASGPHRPYRVRPEGWSSQPGEHNRVRIRLASLFSPSADSPVPLVPHVRGRSAADDSDSSSDLSDSSSDLSDSSSDSESLGWRRVPIARVLGAPEEVTLHIFIPRQPADERRIEARWNEQTGAYVVDDDIYDFDDTVEVYAESSSSRTPQVTRLYPVLPLSELDELIEGRTFLRSLILPHDDEPEASAGPLPSQPKSSDVCEEVCERPLKRARQ